MKIFHDFILIECKISIPCTTLTTKEHVAVRFPELSVKLMETVVDPNGKDCPGLWVIVRCGVTPELSVAVGLTHGAEPLVAVVGTIKRSGVTLYIVIGFGKIRI